MADRTAKLTDSQEKILQYLVDLDQSNLTADQKFQQIVNDYFTDQLESIYAIEKLPEIKQSAEATVQAEIDKTFDEKVTVLENDNII